MTQAPVDPAAGRSTHGAMDWSATVATGRVESGRVESGRRAPVRRRAEPAAWPWALPLAIYSAAVVLVVAWPTPVDAGAHDSFDSFFRRLHAAGAPDWVGYPVLEVSANVAMFIPLGFMVAQLGRRWWFGLVAPAALSVCAELGQELLRPERFATAVDVAANAGGAAVGTVASLLVMGRGRSARTPASTRPGRTRHRAG